LCSLALMVLLVTSAIAQEAGAPETKPKVAETAPATDTIQLNFPENLEVKVLIDYVTKRLGMNILYDQSVGTQRVTISSPTRIPTSSLLGLLESVLKMAGLSLVDAEQPGWKKVVQAKDFLDVTSIFEGDPAKVASAPGATILTQIFVIRNAPTSDVEKVIKPFLTSPGGNTMLIPKTDLLLVTDYAFNLKRIAVLISMVDTSGSKISTRFIPVANRDAKELASDVAKLLADRDKVAEASGKAVNRNLALTADTRSNRLVLITPESAEQDVLDLIKELDVPSEVQTRNYRFQYVSAQRFDKIARELAATDVSGDRYKSVVDAESGLLIVTALPKVHEQIEKLRADLDVSEVSAEQNQVRFYKLMNTTASDMLATISAMAGSTKGSLPVLPVEKHTTTNKGAQKDFTGANTPPPPVGEALPTPPSYKPTSDEEDSTTQAAPAASQLPTMTAKTKDATMTADPNTNTIIVIAPATVQKVYEDLIAALDKRRPQVMVEVTLVTLDTTKNFSLGVELSQRKGVGNDNDALVFSSFGLSKVDPDTGLPELISGTGFNGVLLSPGTVNVVLRALATSGRATVISAPKVLVNDNTTANLASVSEAPFTSVNASQTVSTTSFAGYATAGTTVTVTPHISEGNHLQLEYSVSLNSFKGEGSAGIPPPRQTNTLDSKVTVPDGQVIVVGGLSREDLSDTVSKIPFLGDLPLVGGAFSSRALTNTRSTLFVFIRPVVLRDERFEDLKHLSGKDLKAAKVSGEQSCPPGRPMVMK